MNKVYKTSILITGDEKRGVEALRNTQRATESLDKQTSRLGAQTSVLSKQNASLNKSFGMAGIQVQQFFGQLQGGQSVMVALSQQSADLGIVLGAPMAGVIVSLGAVVAGTLLPSLMNAQDSMSELEQISKDLSVTMSKTGDGVDVLSDHIEKLANRSQSLARLQIASSIVDAEKQISVATKGIISSLDDMEGVFNGAMNISAAADAIRSYSGSLDELPDKINGMIGQGGFAGLSAKLDEVSKDFGVSRQSALSFILAMDELDDNASALTVKALENQLTSMNEEAGGSSKKINELSKSLIPLFESVYSGVDVVNLLRQAYADLDKGLEESSESSEKSAKAYNEVISTLTSQIFALTDGSMAAEKLDIAKSLGLESIEELPEEVAKLISTLQTLKSEASGLKFFEDTNNQLNEQRSKLQLTNAEFAEYKLRMDGLAAGAAPELIDKLVEVAKANEQLKDSIKDEGELQKIIDKNNSYVDSLKEQLTLGSFTGKQLAIETALRQLSAEATDKQVLSVTELAGAIYDQAEASKALDLTDLIKQSEKFGDTWGTVGNVIVDAFGGIANQMNRFSEQQENYNKQLEEYAKQRSEIGKVKDIESREKALKELSSLEAKLNERNLQNQIGMFGTISGAASKMFSEQSKGREALHKAEQVFTAVEIALAFQKASANALKAISSAFAAPFPVNFAMGAAMIGIMSGLGLFGGSSGGSIPSAADVQAGQGTGSVLGSDDKSESLVNSFERFEDIELDQLAELKGIRDNIQNLNSGISQLAISLVSGLNFNDSGYDGVLGKTSAFVGKGITSSQWAGEHSGAIFGDPLGELVDGIVSSFKTKKVELLDSGIAFAAQSLAEVLVSGIAAQTYATLKTTKKSWWGLVKKESTAIEYGALDQTIKDQMSDIFGYIAESVTSAVDLLGFDSAENALDGFAIKLPQISFKDLSGEEIQTELEAIFSQQSDLIAQYLIPSITNYQQIGEGAFETLLRVAHEQTVFNDNLERTGVILNGLSSIDLIDVSQNIIGLMGGLDAFKDASNTFFTEFFSEQEQFAYLQKSLSEVLATMNLSLPETKDGFKNLVQGIDITTEEGQSLYATLLQISGAAAEYYDQLESQTGVLQDNTELLAERAKYEADIADALARMDFTGLQTALVDLNGWYTAQIEQAAALGADTTLLEQLYGRKRNDVIADALEAINSKTSSEMAALTKTHESAVSGLTGDYDQLFAAIGAVSATISSSVLELKRAMTGWNEIAYQATEVTRLRGQLGSGDIANQTSVVDQLIAATMNKWRAELAINDAAISKTEQLISEHESAVDSLESNYSGLFSAIVAVSNTIASSVIELRRAMTGWNEVAYQTAEINRLRDQLGSGDIANQTSVVDQLIAATMNKWRAELANNDEAISRTEKLVSEHESAVNSLENTYSSLFSTINSVAGSISNSILAIRRSMSGWDEVGFQNTNIDQLYGQIGSGSIAEQTSTVQGLIDAINARYQAELDNNNALSDAANERYQAELSAYDSLKNAAESLKKAADNLLLGDLSYLSQGDQLAEAKRQYEQALATGDVAGLQSAGTEYLKIAQEYFSTGSSQYGDIFDQVNSAFRGVNVGSAPSAPAVTKYQNDNLALQQSTIDELSGLQLLLDELNAQALAQQELEAAALQEQLTGFNTELLALQLNANDLAQGAINEINALQLVLSDLNAQAIAQQTIDSANLQTQLSGLNAELLAQQLVSNELAQSALTELTSLQLLLDDLNAQAMTQQTSDLANLQAQLDADLDSLLESSAQQINAVNDMSNNVVAAINAIDVAPVVITQPAPVATTTETKTTTNSNVADFSKDLTKSTQNNDAVVEAVKAVKAEMVNLRRDVNKNSDLIYAQQRLA